MSFLTHEYMEHDNVSLEFASENETFLTNHNEKKIFESASLIKIPIMIYIFSKLNKEERQENLKIEHKVSGSGVLQTLDIPYLSVNDLVQLMIVVSDNTATNILINYFGQQHINLFIQQTLNCKNTELNRLMMDADAIDQGKQNYTTSEDMINMLRYITQHANGDDMLEIMRHQHLNDKVSIFKSFYEDQLIYYSKTGEYDHVANDVGIIQFKEKYYYYSFLSNTENPEKAIKFSHDFGSYMIQSILKC
ncbi:serine hydrolase [Mammaliicoccus lentus]|uniref:serine hydrolase n=1 Tax=Mammaliicoccus lentus TaxID=42858 RepID=UPI003514AB7B